MLCIAIMSLCITLFSCSSMSDKESHQSIPVIDWSIKPETEVLDLEDLADIKYIPLETNDSCLIKLATGLALGNDSIAITDITLQKVFIFDSSGECVGIIDRRGEGPEEFPTMSTTAVDFNRKEVYVYSIMKNRIYTYDFKGGYIGKCTIDRPGQYEAIYNYNDSLLIAHDKTNLSMALDMPNDELYRYITINKKSGEVIPLPIRIEQHIGNTIRWHNSDHIDVVKIAGQPIMCDGNRFVIADYSSDTIFEMNNGVRNILACQTNVDKSRKIPDRVQVEAVLGNLVFLEYIRVSEVDKTGIKFDEEVGGSYVYNLETNELKSYTAKRPYLKQDSKTIHHLGIQSKPSTYCFPIYMDQLMDQAENDNLRGPILDILKSLNEDSNPVLMIASFKN